LSTHVEFKKGEGFAKKRMSRDHKEGDNKNLSAPTETIRFVFEKHYHLKAKTLGGSTKPQNRRKGFQRRKHKGRK